VSTTRGARAAHGGVLDCACGQQDAFPKRIRERANVERVRKYTSANRIVVEACGVMMRASPFQLIGCGIKG
jgi:hypothetical protein